VSSSDDDDGLVVLARFGDLTTAQLVRGRLAADGIVAFLPDEHMATQTWHLHVAIGGIRLQVYKADLERAKEILAQPGSEIAASLESAVEMPENATAKSAAEDQDDDGTIGPGDRAAFRALRVALVSLWLMGLIHPYSLWLALHALGRHDVTAWGRRRAWIALFISLAGCAWLGLLVQRFARLAG
jgi:hypothetical protein